MSAKFTVDRLKMYVDDGDEYEQCAKMAFTSLKLCTCDRVYKSAPSTSVAHVAHVHVYPVMNQYCAR